MRNVFAAIAVLFCSYSFGQQSPLVGYWINTHTIDSAKELNKKPGKKDQIKWIEFLDEFQFRAGNFDNDQIEKGSWSYSPGADHVTMHYESKAGAERILMHIKSVESNSFITGEGYPYSAWTKSESNELAHAKAVLKALRTDNYKLYTQEYLSLEVCQRVMPENTKEQWDKHVAEMFQASKDAIKANGYDLKTVKVSNVEPTYTEYAWKGETLVRYNVNIKDGNGKTGIMIMEDEQKTKDGLVCTGPIARFRE